MWQAGDVITIGIAHVIFACTENVIMQPLIDPSRGLSSCESRPLASTLLLLYKIHVSAELILPTSYTHK